MTLVETKFNVYAKLNYLTWNPSVGRASQESSLKQQEGVEVRGNKFCNSEDLTTKLAPYHHLTFLVPDFSVVIWELGGAVGVSRGAWISLGAAARAMLGVAKLNLLM